MPDTCSNDNIVVTSFKCGTFLRTTGSSASNVPASIGSAAFLAPDIVTVPDNVAPPSIRSLSNGLRLPAPFTPFAGCQRCNRKRMNFIADQLAQAFVDQLMSRQRPLAIEFGRHNERAEVGVVVAFDPDDRIGEPGLD